MRNFVRVIHEFFLKRSKSSLLSIILCIILFLGYLDYITGFEITFSFFYLIPIVIATWYLGRNIGLAAAFFGIVIWLVSNYVAGERYTREIIRYWNASVRVILFVFIILLLDEFKRALNHERLLAHTDHLTGVPNRREFYFQVEAELVRSNRSKHPFTVAYMDVDSFKQVNDLFGHMEGDAILRTIAQSVLSTIRQTDTIARLGGDEFAILLPNTDQEEGGIILKRVHGKLMERLEETKSHATFSIGVITFDCSPASVDEVLHKADEVMYKVKTSGKNDVVYVKV